MVNVTLVCVAGVSGTFLARRMRELDPSLSITVTPLDGFASASPRDGVVLVAPQLIGSLDAIERMSDGAPIAVLTPSAYTAGGGEQALHAVHELIGGAGTGADRSPTTTLTKE